MPNITEHTTSELARINGYATLLATLARTGHGGQVENLHLCEIFADIANVTAMAYSEMQNLITQRKYQDPYDQ